MNLTGFYESKCDSYVKFLIAIDLRTVAINTQSYTDFVHVFRTC